MTDPHATRRAEWQQLRFLLPYLLAFPKRVALAVACLLAAKGATVLLPLALKQIVDALDKSQQAQIFLPVSLLAGYGVLRLASVAFGELRDVVFGRVTERAMHRIALRIFKHLHALDLDFHLSRPTGGVSRDIERGVGGIRFLLRFALFNVAPTVIEILLVTGIVFFYYSVWFAVIIVVSVAAYVGVTAALTEWRTRQIREANRLDARANTRAVDSLLNYETVKYFGNEEFEATHYDADLDAWEAALRRSRQSLGVLNILQALVIALAITAMMILAAEQVVTGNMTLGGLTMVNAYVLQLFLPLNALGFVYRELKKSLADAARMFHLLDLAPAVREAEKPAALDDHRPVIEFDSVRFAYRDDRPILRDISLNIGPGHKVAIVGASGAGKSTLARLLFRFYDVSSGAIRVNGQDIRDLSLSALRNAIGVVPQDTVLFNDTIEYNIRYGRPEADTEAVKNAARTAHLGSLIDELPDGMATTVGERGLKLSGGEKQRIAIARAVLKNPPILIFDEATSSLDSQAEAGITTALTDLAVDHTTLVIAHRLSTVVDADEILVLEHGNVVERGSHPDLIAAGGQYAVMWQAQHQTEADILGTTGPQTIPE